MLGRYKDKLDRNNGLIITFLVHGDGSVPEELIDNVIDKGLEPTALFTLYAFIDSGYFSDRRNAEHIKRLLPIVSKSPKFSKIIRNKLILKDIKVPEIIEKSAKKYDTDLSVDESFKTFFYLDR
jgi:hypothetical protein